MNQSRPTPSRRPALDTLTLLLVGWSIAMSVSAQLLLRRGMGDLGNLSGLALYMEAIQSWYVPGGILAYGLGTMTWLVVLSRLDLAAAYPLGSFNYVLVTILSATVLGETVPGLRWVGTSLILVGILVIAIGERKADNSDDAEEPTR